MGDGGLNLCRVSHNGPLLTVSLHVQRSSLLHTMLIPQVLQSSIPFIEESSMYRALIYNRHLHKHTHMHARTCTHTHTLARMHACTHMQAHAHTHALTERPQMSCSSSSGLNMLIKLVPRITSPKPFLNELNCRQQTTEKLQQCTIKWVGNKRQCMHVSRKLACNVCVSYAHMLSHICRQSPAVPHSTYINQSYLFVYCTYIGRCCLPNLWLAGSS